MDSRLFIELTIDEKGRLRALDQTLYERFIDIDIANYATIEQVEKHSNKASVEHMHVYDISHGVDVYDFLRSTWPFLLEMDGAYTYRKLVIPRSDIFFENGVYLFNASEETPIYFEYNWKLYKATVATAKDLSTCAEVSFREVWENRDTYANNILSFSNDIISTYKLSVCLTNLQRLALNDIISNGCRSGCIDRNNETKVNRDFLMNSLYLINWLAYKKDYKEADRIISNLNTCSSICNNITSNSGCGCGNII